MEVSADLTVRVESPSFSAISTSTFPCRYSLFIFLRSARICAGGRFGLPGGRPRRGPSTTCPGFSGVDCIVMPFMHIGRATSAIDRSGWSEPIRGSWWVAKADRGSSLDQRSRRRPHEAHWQHMSRRRAALAGNAWVSRTRRWSRPSDHEGMRKRHAPEQGLIPRLPRVSSPVSGCAPPAEPSTVTAWVMATTGDRNGWSVRAALWRPFCHRNQPVRIGGPRRIRASASQDVGAGAIGQEGWAIRGTVGRVLRAATTRLHAGSQLDDRCAWELLDEVHDPGRACRGILSSDVRYSSSSSSGCRVHGCFHARPLCYVDRFKPTPFHRFAFGGRAFRGATLTGGYGNQAGMASDHSGACWHRRWRSLKEAMRTRVNQSISGRR